jgi:type IV secretion system protein VirB10
VNSRWWRKLFVRQIGPDARDAAGVGIDADPMRPAILDRGMAISADGGALRSRMSNLLGIALLALLCAGFMSWYYSHAAARRGNATPRSAAVPVKGDFVLPPLNLPKSPVPVAAPSANTSMVADTAYAVGNVLDGLASPGAGGGFLLPHAASAGAAAGSAGQLPRGSELKTSWELARERRLDTAVWVREPTPVQSLPSSDRAASATEATSLVTAGGEGTHTAARSRALNDLLHPAIVATARAEVLPTQRLLLPKGAFIDCTLETAIDSTLPGLTTCITPVDTYGADGTVVLLERGTKLIGETRGDVQQGSSRVFVLWTEARTPLGVIVPLASPGTDELGRSGLPGDTNHHFFERFGAAILVSVIDGAMQAAANSRSEGSSGSTIVMNPSGTQDVLTEVLRSTISIPPTVSKPQGDRIEILVARDLDFRSVYQLHVQ